MKRITVIIIVVAIISLFFLSGCEETYTRVTVSSSPSYRHFHRSWYYDHYDYGFGYHRPPVVIHTPPVIIHKPCPPVVIHHRTTHRPTPQIHRSPSRIRSKPPSHSRSVAK